MTLIELNHLLRGTAQTQNLFKLCSTKELQIFSESLDNTLWGGQQLTNSLFVVGVTESQTKKKNLFEHINLAEAQYSVGLFMYLRLMGIGPEQISIITTFASQKNLIKEIHKRKCAWHETFGNPLKISTLDEEKSDSNNVIIFSMVHSDLDLNQIKKITSESLSKTENSIFILTSPQVKSKLFEEYSELEDHSVKMNLPENYMSLYKFIKEKCQ
jgi:superfamily I DNA and/or RNA helicase